MPYRILIQGMTADMSVANGDYDSAFEYQVNTPDELLDVLRRVAPLQEPPAPPDADICPPNLVVDLGEEMYTFMPVGGNLYCNNTNGYVTPEQALQVVTTPGVAAMARQAVQQQSGVTPARMAHIPPTDRENFAWEALDMGPHQPQVHFPIQTAHDSKSDIWVWGIVGVILLGLGIFMLITGAVPGLIIVAAGAGCLWFSRRAAGKAIIIARVGFDWNWNALWFHRPDEEVPGYLLDANLVTDVIFEMGKETEDVVFVPGENMVAGGGTYKYWNLRFPATDGNEKLLDYRLRFFKKADMEYAVQAIRGLLASQR